MAAQPFPDEPPGPNDAIMAPMNKPQPTSPRARLQALLAIPERQRTDAEWDEIIDLEITLAPGNREGAGERDMRRNANPGQGRQNKPGNQPGPMQGPGQGQGQGQGQGHPGQKPGGKKSHKRSRRGRAP